MSRSDADWIIRMIQPYVDEYKKLTAEYAQVAAENERLRSASFVTAVPSEEYETLKAENERLRNYLDRIDLALNQSKDKAVDILIEWRREQGDLP